jgi:hypothetical protein
VRDLRKTIVVERTKRRSEFLDAIDPVFERSTPGRQVPTDAG